MSFHSTSVTNIFSSLGGFTLSCIFPQIFSCFGDEMRLSFLVNLKDYYHKHDIWSFFHDHDHIIVHVHDFGMMLHSLQGMTQSNWTRLVFSKALLRCTLKRGGRKMPRGVLKKANSTKGVRLLSRGVEIVCLTKIPKLTLKNKIKLKL